MPNRTVLVSFLASVLACTFHAHAGGAPTRYFDLVNASHDSVTSLAVAPAGDRAFHEIDLGAPLRGGVTSTTVEIPRAIACAISAWCSPTVASWCIRASTCAAIGNCA